ncbi:hypothetical protein GCM10023238_31760 [Streptomyces heliomycini]
MFQFNGAGTLNVSNFAVKNFGTFVRSCGNCSTQYKRTINLNTIEVTWKGSRLAGINTNYGDSATLRNITIIGDGSKKIVPCQKYIGNNTGKERAPTAPAPTARTASTRRPTSPTGSPPRVTAVRGVPRGVSYGRPSPCAPAARHAPPTRKRACPVSSRRQPLAGGPRLLARRSRATGRGSGRDRRQVAHDGGERGEPLGGACGRVGSLRSVHGNGEDHHREGRPHPAGPRDDAGGADAQGRPWRRGTTCGIRSAFGARPVGPGGRGAQAWRPAAGGADGPDPPGLTSSSGTPRPRSPTPSARRGWAATGDNAFGTPPAAARAGRDPRPRAADGGRPAGGPPRAVLSVRGGAVPGLRRRRSGG